MWDLTTGECLRRLTGHTEPISSVAWLTPPDGQAPASLCASGSGDGTVRVWDINTDACLQTFDTQCRVGTIAVAPCRGAFNGSVADWCLVASSHLGGLSAWDPLSGVRLWHVSGDDTLLNGVAICPPAAPGDRWLVLGASHFNKVRLWDLLTGTVLRMSLPHDSTVQAVAAMAVKGGDGTSPQQLAVTGSWDDAVKLWDLRTGACIRLLKGHRGLVYAVGLTPDGATAISGGWDKTVRVWQTQSGQCLRVFEGHTSVINDVAFDTAAQRVISAGGEIKLWDLSVTQEAPREHHRNSVRSVDLGCTLVGSPPGHAEGLVALSASKDMTVKVWEAATGRFITTLEPLEFEAFGVAFLPDRRRVITVDGGPYQGKCGEMKLWDLATGKAIWTIDAVGGRFFTPIVTPDGRFLLSFGDADQETAPYVSEMKLWDLETGKLLRIISGPYGSSIVQHGHIYRHDLVPGGRYLVLMTDYARVEVIDLHAMECRLTLRGTERRGIAYATLAPDGRSLKAGKEEECWIWDLVDGTRLGPFKSDQLRGPAWFREAGRLLTHAGESARAASLDEAIEGRFAREWEGWFTMRDVMDPARRAACPGGSRETAWNLSGDQRTLAGGSPWGDVSFWHLENADIGPLRATAERVWRYGSRPGSDKPDAILTALCAACGSRFEVPDAVLEALRRAAALAAPGLPPALAATDAAYEDLYLLANCPRCGHELRFYPFVGGLDPDPLFAPSAESTGWWRRLFGRN